LNVDPAIVPAIVPDDDAIVEAVIPGDGIVVADEAVEADVLVLLPHATVPIPSTPTSPTVRTNRCMYASEIYVVS